MFADIKNCRVSYTKYNESTMGPKNGFKRRFETRKRSILKLKKV